DGAMPLAYSPSLCNKCHVTAVVGPPLLLISGRLFRYRFQLTKAAISSPSQSHLCAQESFKERPFALRSPLPLTLLDYGARNVHLREDVCDSA
ncbi:unnamed protein product, partial [Dovyalis caffra]